VAEITDEYRVAQDVENVARSSLLHQYRNDPRVQRAVVEQHGDRMGERLTGHVIEIRL
jgi:hypothetical protein